MQTRRIRLHLRPLRIATLTRLDPRSALGVKAVFLVLALLGHSSLWLAILADTGATLVVIANALRLLKAREPKKP